MFLNKQFHFELILFEDFSEFYRALLLYGTENIAHKSIDIFSPIHQIDFFSSTTFFLMI